MRIRSVRVTDTEVVNVLLGQLGYPQDGFEATATRIRRYWIDNPDRAAYVAVDAQGNVQGVIAIQVIPFFEHDGGRARIVALVVFEETHGQGVGTQLEAAAVAFAVSHGCSQMEVTSATRREGAHKFYLGRGYVDQAGEALRFLKDLPQS